jgi:hypothetical protein
MGNIRTTRKQRYRIPLQVPFLLVGILATSCSTWVNSDWGDCGYSAFYEIKSDGESPEIVISQITAETVGGHRNCGFQYIKTKVDRAEIHGTQLPESSEPDQYAGNNYFDAVPEGFDPRKSAITIHMDGSKYRSDPTSVNQTDKNVNVKLEPVWW